MTAASIMYFDIETIVVAAVRNMATPGETKNKASLDNPKIVFKVMSSIVVIHASLSIAQAAKPHFT